MSSVNTIYSDMYIIFDYIRLEAFIAVKIHIVAFWVIIPHSLLGKYQCFGKIYGPIFRVEEESKCVPLNC
jgi:hypothetical protein